MATPWVTSLLSLLALSAVHLSQQTSEASQQVSAASQQAPAASQQASAAEQLYHLLGQTVGETVLSALSDQHQQQQQRGAANDSQPACQRQPKPLASQEVYVEPKQRACARSCLQLRDQGGSPQDGVYWFTGMPVPVLCDFSHDGGGWTLLLTSVSKAGWDLLSAKSRREGSPSLTDNYSILRYADAIRDLSSGGRFAYRIEAQAQTARRRWGGVWLAPRSYSFVDETGSQTGVRLVRRFDKWVYKDMGIEQRMPWLRVEGGDNAVLTTTAVNGIHWWGTLVIHESSVHSDSYHHSPWMNTEAIHSGTVLYWMREDEL